jgi:hypothetical protein
MTKHDLENVRAGETISDSANQGGGEYRVDRTFWVSDSQFLQQTKPGGFENRRGVKGKKDDTHASWSEKIFSWVTRQLKVRRDASAGATGPHWEG